jgi:hypothetical protein
MVHSSWRVDIELVDFVEMPPGVDLDGRYQWSRAPLFVGLLALVPGIATIIAGSMPGGDLWALLLAVALWFAVVVGWVGAWVSSDMQRLKRFNRPRRSWALAPIVLVLSCVVALSGFPLSARFALSRPAFERVPQLGLTDTDSAQVGLYELRCCFEKTDFGYRFVVSGDVDAVWGFAYSADSPPPGPEVDGGIVVTTVEGEDVYRHLDGPWYVWESRDPGSG